MRRFLLTLLLLISVKMLCLAQFGRLFTPDDLLSSSLVNDIIQDPKGFVWIATQDGLNCYDSHHMTVFHRGDGSGLQSNDINCVWFSKDGRIFVGTSEGLQYFNFNTSHFYDIPLLVKGIADSTAFVTSITDSREGDVLVSTSGRGAFRIKKGTTNVSRITPSCGEYLRNIFEDSHGRLWISTDNDGLYMISGNKKVQYLADEQHRGEVSRVVEDRMGNIYVSTLTDGLFMLSNTTGDFSAVDVTHGINVSSVKLSHDGTIYIGSDGNGMMIYDPMAKTIRTASFYSSEININRAKVHSIMEDASGNIWIAAFQKGVFLIPAETGGFNYIGHRSATFNCIGNYCVMSLKVGHDGVLWVGTDQDGLYSINQDGSCRAHYVAGQNGIPATVLSITEDENHNLWLGSYLEGVGMFNPASGMYRRISSFTGLAKNVFGVMADGKGKVWAVTMGGGVWVVDVATGETETFRADGNNPNALVSDYLLSMSFSRDGKKVYLCTCDGLACYDIAKKSFISEFGQKAVLLGLQVTNVRETADGTLWAGAGGGLYRIRNHGKDVKLFTTADGLPNNTIRSMEIDGDNFLWISTNRGLSHMDIAKETFVNYGMGNGLQGNEFSSSASCFYDGRFVFGGNNGITFFRNTDITRSKKKLSVQLVEMRTAEQKVVMGMKSGIYNIVDTAVIDANRFDLSHSNNSFTLRFSAMEFANSEQVVYEYRINKGDWVRLSNGMSEVTFSNLPSGTYRFAVRANYNDTYSDERQFTIVVHPAWYASIWAYLLYALLIAAAIWFIVQQRRRKEQERLRIQEHIHAEQLNEAKIQFFMNISHDIRTPMTLIMSPLQKLITTDKDPTRQKQYQLMERNGKRIQSLIDQLMDLRKIDKGMMQMNFKQTDVVAMLNDINSLFDYQAAERNISTTFNHKDKMLLADIDRVSFDKIVMNVLGNAFKYVPDGGWIKMDLEREGDTFTLKIANSGNGIEPDKLERIFDRFYQVDTAGSPFAGTGIGLHLTRSLVMLHGGSVTAHNIEGEGCYFLITLPLKQGGIIHDVDAVEKGQEAAASNIADDVITDVDEEGAVDGAQSSRRKTVLIVEDDSEIRQYLVGEFSGQYAVQDCSNGREGLEYALKHVPDLIITDLMMPVMDGLTMCQKLKRNVNTNHVPVIILTAKTSDEDRLEGLGAGADAYIVKPFNIEILSRAASNLIQSRQVLRNKFTGKETQDERVEQVKLKTPDERLLERIMLTINSNISNPDLSVEFISQEVGISRAHLHRKLKELTNQSPRDFIRNIRLKQAANLLASGNQNVTEVMYAVGMQNAASFSTMFKNFYGVSPKEYTKEHGKKEE